MTKHDRNRPARRSHAERNAGTIDLLVNAAIDAIAAVGLRNATTGEICRRAGVSVGAMFHYFDTQLDVIVAAVEYHLADRFDRYTRYIDSQRNDDGIDPVALIRFMRSIAREPRSMVWLEAVMQTRTNPEMRARLQPILQRQREFFRSVAASQPGLDAMPVGARQAWLELLRNVMHGEAMWEHAIPHEGLDELTLDALLALAGDMGALRRVPTA